MKQCYSWSCRDIRAYWTKKIPWFFLLTIISVSIHAQTSEPYNWNNVAIGGGGFVSAIIPSKSQANLFYARTDVGGAYRWDAASTKWTPLLDWVSDNEVGYLGVESIALDPNAPGKLYMLVGISYFNSGKSAILKSDDYGNTFTITDVTSQFKAHGNGMGRQNGERLQVDPNDGNILYCGTRWNGLFKSTNSGATWSRLTSLTVTTTPNENGISVVALDPTSVLNSATQRIFAGVSRTGTNFYRSENGGQSFTAVTGGPTDLMPQRAIITGGFVYVTYANGAGPHGHWAVPEPFDLGQIWKYEISTGIWSNITPSGFTRPFGGICADPANPQRLIASTINTWMYQDNAYGDRFLLTTNGGAGWTDVVARGFDLDPNGITWIDKQSIHWSGSIEFDPFNTQKVIVTSGNGIFVNDNIDATLGIWKFTVKGLEEAVPRALESITNGPLLTVISDYDGFRHTDPLLYAPIHTPRIGTTTGLAYAAQNPNKVLRAGDYMYYSTDMAQSWTQCTTSGTKGQVAVSADGTIFLHCPDASSITYRSADNGSSWTTVTGVNVTNARPVADPVNSSKFYIYDSGNGNVLVSTNGGSSFATSGSTASGGSKVIRVVPGKEGDVWIPLYSGGLSRSSNSGQTFSTISGVSYCGAVGFGKAAAGNTFPAIYIWGTVNSVTGIYRSIDEGVSWVRVNDDAHEYGGPANGQFVQGDMNVYGRVYMSTAGRGVVFGDAAPPANLLTVNPTSLSFTSAGGVQTVNVTSNVSWSVSSNVPWLTVSPLSGSNNGSFLVNAVANSGTVRSGVITVTGGVITRTINVSQAGTSSTIVIRGRGTAGGEIIELRLDNVVAASWTLTKSFANYTATGSGAVTVHFINDGKRKDVQIDYATIGGVTYQAEGQPTNTGVYMNSTCGGSYSEWLHCNGYISFNTEASAAGRQATQSPNVPEKTSDDDQVIVAYPNPVRNRLTVRLKSISPYTRISILGSTGQLYSKEKPENLEHVVDMTPMPSGLYFIAVTENATRSVVKVFKK